MKGTGAKRNVCPGSCVSTGAKFPVAPVESAPMHPTEGARFFLGTIHLHSVRKLAYNIPKRNFSTFKVTIVSRSYDKS